MTTKESDCKEMSICLGYDGCRCFRCDPKSNFKIERFGMSEWIVCLKCGKKLALISHQCSMTKGNKS